MRLKDLGFSKLSLLFVLLFIWSALLINKQWETKNVIASDMNSYYIYLPAAFIYHDLTFKYINNNLPEEVLRSSWAMITEDGKHRVSKTSCGVAIMIAPFFFMAKILSHNGFGPANGYSTVFALFVCLSFYFYLLIGLIYLHKILKYFFDDITTGLTIIAIGLGTNLYFYSTYSLNTPHAFCFCLFSIFAWKTIQWHNRQTRITSIIMGLLLGLITLVRPNDIIIFLFPILYGIYDKKTFIEKMKLLTKNWVNILLVVIFFIITIIPQLIIWKYQTGYFLYYSYQKERFYFNHPHIIDGLFGFRKGLFIYTPILLLIIPGFIFAWKKRQGFAFAIVIFFLLNCYIIFSWWSWWYGASFGIRPMIGCYALLALPIGCCIQELRNKNKILKYFIVITVFLLVSLNQFQTLQSQTNLLHYSEMTFKSYKLIFGKLNYPKGWEESLTPNDNEMAVKGLPERNFYETFYFLKGKRENNVALKAFNGKYVSVDTVRNNFLIAKSSNVNSSEIFKMRIIGFEDCKILSSYNKYVSFETLEEGRLVADRDNAVNWERFTIEKMPNNKFAIKADNGKYVKPNLQNKSILEATSNTITDKELFEIIPQ
jgi:hypothetical protein